MYAVSVYVCYIATKINLIINNRVSLHNSMNFHSCTYAGLSAHSCGIYFL